METNGMVVINGRAASDCPARYTFSASSGNSVVDLVWVNSACVERVGDLCVRREATLSDHFAVSVMLDKVVDLGGRSEQRASSRGREIVRWNPEGA